MSYNVLHTPYNETASRLPRGEALASQAEGLWLAGFQGPRPGLAKAKTTPCPQTQPLVAETRLVNGLLQLLLREGKGRRRKKAELANELTGKDASSVSEPLPNVMSAVVLYFWTTTSRLLQTALLKRAAPCGSGRAD
ncbi:uncharacterized protein SPSK_00615 [Sporothrix schenckii 1099-18]|uniref:Uncharacterized protein n=1 Tax=Sporothrix schenckii 1099-18 TaxID=1397361 RepID=A0A0F2LTF6_SPOSC|nr:uncharacterized protein SPSK_00615 [Sporothrix schenckii 1099-18]KJR80139.1 hypothetical protein SPSK_00615 [Sporothrix schenckii 1099-18]